MAYIDTLVRSKRSGLMIGLKCSFEEGLKLVDLRGKSMQQAADAQPSGMVSVIGLDADTVSSPNMCTRRRI